MENAYWGQDKSTWIGDHVPGPTTIFHFFHGKFGHRRVQALCGAEMLTTTYPTDGSLSDLAFDSRRWPICRICAHTAGLAKYFDSIAAVMTPWPRLPKTVILAAPDGGLVRGPVNLPNGIQGRPLRRVGDADDEWSVEFAPGVHITLLKAWLRPVA